MAEGKLSRDARCYVPQRHAGIVAHAGYHAAIGAESQVGDRSACGILQGPARLAASHIP